MTIFFLPLEQEVAPIRFCDLSLESALGEKRDLPDEHRPSLPKCIQAQENLLETCIFRLAHRCNTKGIKH